jgi:IS5 family transposase
MVCPRLHQLAPLFEKVTAPVGRFGLVLDHMGKRGLTNLVCEMGALRCPIAEGGTEAMHRHALDLHTAEYIARGGQMVDATIVPVPKQRNSREENETVKHGETPVAWEEKPAKNRQKDKDARWTKKHGKSFFGYKNHVNADKTHKLIRDYEVTDAAVHDSRVLEMLLDETNTSKDVFGDSAYRSAEAEEKLAARSFRSRICVRGTRGRPLSKARVAANGAKSRIRARTG